MANTTEKKVVILVVRCGDQILVEQAAHGGGEIIFLPAISNNGEQPIDERAQMLAKQILGKDQLNPKPYGMFVDVITKPEVTVEIHANLYQLLIQPEVKTELKLDPTYHWATQSELDTDPRARRDRRLFQRIFDPTPLDLTYAEDQLGEWIDAKVTTWVERPSRLG